MKGRSSYEHDSRYRAGPLRGNEDQMGGAEYAGAPGHLERKIVELTGITEEMLVGAPKIEEVLPKFLDFIGDRVLVAHNSDFDTGFIRAECARR